MNTTISIEDKQMFVDTMLSMGVKGELRLIDAARYGLKNTDTPLLLLIELQQLLEKYPEYQRERIIGYSLL